MVKRMKHAILRLQQRHGLWLTDYDLMNMVEQINTGESEFLVRFSRNFTLHRVSHGSERLPVIYSKRHKIILTVYQNKWVSQNKDGSYKMRKRK